jgi:hypothetical protein
MGWFTRKERPTLGKMQETLQLREENFDSKIAKFDQELLQYKSQLKKLKPGTPAYQSVKQKAMGVLKKKKYVSPYCFSFLVLTSTRVVVVVLKNVPKSAR